MFTFGVPLHGKSPYVKSLLLVEKKQDFVIRDNRLKLITGNVTEPVLNLSFLPVTITD